MALRIGTKTYFFFIESDLFDISEDKYFSEIIEISSLICFISDNFFSTILQQRYSNKYGVASILLVLENFVRLFLIGREKSNDEFFNEVKYNVLSIDDIGLFSSSISVIFYLLLKKVL
jgi:hypothetical protein